MYWEEPEPLLVLDAPMRWCDRCRRYITDAPDHDDREGGCSREHPQP